MGESGPSGSGRYWDHEDCPRGNCDGELQQQDKFNVMCLSCYGVWTHVKSKTKHYLQTVDFETVAEKPAAITDGEGIRFPRHNPNSYDLFDRMREPAVRWKALRVWIATDHDIKDNRPVDPECPVHIPATEVP